MKKLIITGFVGKDAEVLFNQKTGESFARFSVGIAVGTKQEPKTDWVEVSCNDKLLDVARNFVKKGGRVLVEGFPKTQAYISKEGKAVSVLMVHAHILELLGRASDEEHPVDTVEQNN